MPVIYIKALTQDKQETRNLYECPIYKTRERGQTFVWTFSLRTKEKPSKWILAGVSLLLQIQFVHIQSTMLYLKSLKSSTKTTKTSCQDRATRCHGSIHTLVIVQFPQVRYTFKSYQTTGPLCIRQCCTRLYCIAWKGGRDSFQSN